MPKNGHIKKSNRIHKKINLIQYNPGLIDLYEWCLSKSNQGKPYLTWFKTNQGMIDVEIKVNQFVCSRPTAAKELDIPQSTFYKRLKNLQRFGYIIIESKSTLYTIVTTT